MVSAYRQAVPELLIPLTADHYIALLPKKWRGIHHYGVNLDLRRYDSEALGTLRNKRSPDRRHAGQWPIHVDPYNPMIVWLQLEDEFIPLSWRSPYSNMPMADEIWRIARAQAAARGEEAPTNDDLNEVLRRFMSTGNKSLTSRERKRAKSNMTDPLGITNQAGDALPSIYGRGARDRADQQRRLDRRGCVQLAGGASVRAHASSGRNGVMFDDLLAQFDFDAPTVNFDYTTKEGWRSSSSSMLHVPRLAP